MFGEKQKEIVRLQVQNKELRSALYDERTRRRHDSKYIAVLSRRVKALEYSLENPSLKGWAQ